MITLEKVKHIPNYNDLAQNVLYVSDEFGCAVHLCGCGCGVEVVTPINDEFGWVLRIRDDLFSLTPSIGNYQLACQSHYYITDSEFVMC